MSLAPTTQIKAGIPSAEIKYIAGHLRLNYDQVIQLIEKILEETLRLTLVELEIWIDRFVPKRTGQLRQNLKDNLKSSYIRSGILRFILGTNIDYAKFVNEMITMRVRHVGELGYAYYYKHHGPIMLNDPEAIGYFFTEFIKYAKERAMVNLAKAKAQYLGGTGILGRMIGSRLVT